MLTLFAPNPEGLEYYVSCYVPRSYSTSRALDGEGDMVGLAFSKGIVRPDKQAVFQALQLMHPQVDTSQRPVVFGFFWSKVKLKMMHSTCISLFLNITFNFH